VSVFSEIIDSQAGQVLARYDFRPDPEGKDVLIKDFADVTLAVQIDRPGLMKAPRKLKDPVLLDIFSRGEPTPAMRIRFPSVTAFMEHVYDWR
jgi:hypothetical protein